MGNGVAEPVFPGTGIVAGCAFATTELRAFLSITFACHAIPVHRVHFAVFLVDLGFDACGDNERNVRDENMRVGAGA